MRFAPLRSLVAVSAFAWAAAGGASLGRAEDQRKEPPADAPAGKTTTVKVTAGSDGFALQSESGDFKLQLRGLVQLDGRFYPADDANLATDVFLSPFKAGKSPLKGLGFGVAGSTGKQSGPGGAA